MTTFVAAQEILLNLSTVDIFIMHDHNKMTVGK